MLQFFGKKAALFGALGIWGCLAGWLVGEIFLQLAIPKKGAGGEAAATLVSRGESPPPPPPKEFADRLKGAGAKSGSVQLTLEWDDKNDLDLHCVDPSGHEICYRTRTSPTGGELDIDRNSLLSELVTNPVEHIVWIGNSAPVGHYRWFVSYYTHYDGIAPDQSKFRYNLLVDGVQTQGDGIAAKEGEDYPLPDFEVKPKVRLAVPDKIRVSAGGQNRLRVVALRSDPKEPVNIHPTGDLEGLTLADGVVAAGQTETEIPLSADFGAKVGVRTITLNATASGATETAELPLEVAAAVTSSIKDVLIIGGWTGLLAMGLALALVGGQNRVLGKPLLAARQAALVAGGSLAAGALAGATGQTLQGLLAHVPYVRQLGFLGGWTLLGVLLAVGVGFFIPNLPRKRAAVAGAIGGFIGAIAFLIGSQSQDIAGRLLGAGLLGLAIGVVVAVAEAMVRTAKLEVRFGHSPKDVKMVNLGPEPVTIGDRACTISARGVTGPALRYRLIDQKLTCEDVAQGVRQDIADGDTRVLANLTLIVHAEASAVAPAPPAQVRPPSARPAARGFGEVSSSGSPPVETARLSAGTPGRLRLRFGERNIPVAAGTRLTPKDIPGLTSSRPDGVIAEVLGNPKRPADLGLKNHSTDVWTLVDGSAPSKPVMPGNIVGLTAGKKILFGRITVDVVN